MNSKDRIFKKLPTGDSREAESYLLNKQAHIQPQHLIPSDISKEDYFCTKVKASLSQLILIKDITDIPKVVVNLINKECLKPQIKIAPTAELNSLPWHEYEQLHIEFGTANPQDHISLNMAFCGIAETGTLMLCSSPQSPVLINFLPDYQLVVIKQKTIVETYEQAWQRLRENFSSMPRTINWITGPSRTADIEQTMELGAHGPKKTFVILIEQA